MDLITIALNYHRAWQNYKQNGSHLHGTKVILRLQNNTAGKIRIASSPVLALVALCRRVHGENDDYGGVERATVQPSGLVDYEGKLWSKTTSQFPVKKRHSDTCVGIVVFHYYPDR